MNLMISMPAELIDVVKEYARSQGVPYSALIATFCRHGLAEVGQSVEAATALVPAETLTKSQEQVLWGYDELVKEYSRGRGDETGKTSFYLGDIRKRAGVPKSACLAALRVLQRRKILSSFVDERDLESWAKLEDWEKKATQPLKSSDSRAE